MLTAITTWVAAQIVGMGRVAVALVDRRANLVRARGDAADKVLRAAGVSLSPEQALLVVQAITGISLSEQVAADPLTIRTGWSILSHRGRRGSRRTCPADRYAHRAESW